MADGAHLGMTASNALKVILGGEPQEEQVRMTNNQFATWIRTCPDTEPDENTDRYSEASRLMARCFLAVMETQPAVEWSISSRSGVNVYEIANATNPDAAWAFDGCTGFMVGWAFNAARKVLGMAPVRNPAIMTIEGI